MKFLMQCIITENTLIKLAHYDEIKKRAHDPQIVGANKNLKLSYGGPSQRHVLGTNKLIKALQTGPSLSLRPEYKTAKRTYRTLGYLIFVESGFKQR